MALVPLFQWCIERRCIYTHVMMVWLCWILHSSNSVLSSSHSHASADAEHWLEDYGEDWIGAVAGWLFDVDKLVLTEFWMDFFGVRDASKISQKLHCFLHLTKVHPCNLQQLTSNGRKALIPGKRLTDDTIFGNDLLPPLTILVSFIFRTKRLDHIRQ